MENASSEMCPSMPHGDAALQPATVVICDDKPELRSAVQQLLASTGRFTVVGEACDDVTCLETVRRLRPDLLILDINMPGGGPHVAQGVKNIAPATYIVVYSGRHEYAIEQAMRAAGANDYVLKTGRVRPLIAALSRMVPART